MSTSAPTTPKRGAISGAVRQRIAVILLDPIYRQERLPANAVGQIRGEPTDPLRTVYLGVGEATQLP